MCQTDFILEDNTPITMDKFQQVFDKLMKRDWAIEVTPNNYRVFNLARSGWKWDYHHRKRALGTCTYSRGMGFGKVLISKKLVEINLHKYAGEFEDTIRHEIAHAIDYMIRDRSCHDSRWKNLAVQVGASPTRTAVDKQFERPEFKWTGYCPNGHKHNRHKLTRNAKRASCKRCCDDLNGGRFSSEYIITWKQNY